MLVCRPVLGLALVGGFLCFLLRVAVELLELVFDPGPDRPVKPDRMSTLLSLVAFGFLALELLLLLLPRAAPRMSSRPLMELIMAVVSV
jgi:hypothetical protein